MEFSTEFWECVAILVAVFLGALFAVVLWHIGWVIYERRIYRRWFKECWGENGEIYRRLFNKQKRGEGGNGY